MLKSIFFVKNPNLLGKTNMSNLLVSDRPNMLGPSDRHNPFKTDRVMPSPRRRPSVLAQHGSDPLRKWPARVSTARWLGIHSGIGIQPQ
jgi:hypothetical protein